MTLASRGEDMGAPTPCTCGVAGCRELGWPHDWDPLVNGDSCSVAPPPIGFVTVGDTTMCWPLSHTPHPVTAPYERWGSGHACVDCIALHAPEVSL